LKYYASKEIYDAGGDHLGSMSCEGMQYEPLGLTSDGFCFALIDANQRRLECACPTYEERREWENYVGERQPKSNEAPVAMNRAPERVLLYLTKRSVLHRPAREILDFDAQAYLFKDLQGDDEAMRFCFPERYAASQPQHAAAERGGAGGSGAGLRSSSIKSEHAARVKRGSIINSREHQARVWGGGGGGGGGGVPPGGGQEEEFNHSRMI